MGLNTFWLHYWVLFLLKELEDESYCFGAIGQALTMMALTIATWQADKQRENGGGTGAGIAAAVFLFVFNSVFECCIWEAHGYCQLKFHLYN